MQDAHPLRFGNQAKTNIDAIAANAATAPARGKIPSQSADTRQSKSLFMVDSLNRAT